MYGYNPPPTMPEQLEHAKNALATAIPWALGIGAMILLFHKGRWR